MRFTIIFNRLIKFSGALVKAFSYPFYALFPNKRFTIPTDSAAWAQPPFQGQITATVWQTNYTNRVTLPVYVNYLFNRLMARHYAYRYVSTEERQAYLHAHGSAQQINAYEQLTDGASQADFWRLFVLIREGGVYMDIDAHLVCRLSKMIAPDTAEIFLLNKQHYTNYFIAVAPNNRHLQKTLDIIIANIEQRNIGGGVYDLTGPTALNLAIGDQTVNHRFYRYTCNQGSFTNEHFQYLDKPRGKWTYADKNSLLKESANPPDADTLENPPFH